MNTEIHYLGMPTREGGGGGVDSEGSADLERGQGMTPSIHYTELVNLKKTTNMDDYGNGGPGNSSMVAE